MKGQFFILGAIIICIALYTGLLTTRLLITSGTDYMSYFSSNIQRELPKVLNFGLNTSSSTDTLKNFTWFVDNTIAGHMIDYSSLWLVGVGNGSTDLNLTVFNFLGYPVSVRLDLSGSVKNISVTNNATNSTLFTSVSPQFDITILHNDQSSSSTWQRDKANLYAWIKLERGEDFIIKKILA